MVNNQKIHIRKMTENDYVVMSNWLSTKEVLQFYGDVHSPFSIEMVKKKYGPRIRGEINVPPFIVELERQPIGFLQYYFVKDNEAFGFASEEIIYGIDQFIGDPSLFGQGIGARMVSLFIDLIYQSTDATMIMLDTAVNNTRAIACYEKVGWD